MLTPKVTYISLAEACAKKLREQQERELHLFEILMDKGNRK